MRLAMMLLVASLAVPAAMGASVRPAGAQSSDAHSPAATCRFTDPDFGAQPHALDIDTVTVARSTSSLLAFRMTFVDGLTFQRDQGFHVSLDTDRDNATGDEAGDDYYLDYVETSPRTRPELGAWSGSEWVPQPDAPVTFTRDPRGVAFELPSTAIGDPGAFDFSVGAGADVSSDAPDVDFAPQREHALVSPDTWEWSFPSCAKVDIGQSPSDVPTGIEGVMVVVASVLMVAGGALAVILKTRSLKRDAASIPVAGSPPATTPWPAPAHAGDAPVTPRAPRPPPPSPSRPVEDEGDGRMSRAKSLLLLWLALLASLPISAFAAIDTASSPASNGEVDWALLLLTPCAAAVVMSGVVLVRRLRLGWFLVLAGLIGAVTLVSCALAVGGADSTGSSREPASTTPRATAVAARPEGWRVVGPAALMADATVDGPIEALAVRVTQAEPGTVDVFAVTSRTASDSWDDAKDSEATHAVRPGAAWVLRLPVADPASCVVMAHGITAEGSSLPSRSSPAELEQQAGQSETER